LRNRYRQCLARNGVNYWVITQFESIYLALGPD